MFNLMSQSFLFAQDSFFTFHWPPDSFGMSLLSTVTFGTIGIVMAILGFKLFDKLTPGKLDEEIIHKQNIAAAILAGAVILGLCLVVAAAIH